MSSLVCSGCFLRQHGALHHSGGSCALARLQFAEGLLADVKAMPHQEQLQFMRDLAANKNTPQTRSYGVLSNNTKLGLLVSAG